MWMLQNRVHFVDLEDYEEWVMQLQQTAVEMNRQTREKQVLHVFQFMVDAQLHVTVCA